MNDSTALPPKPTEPRNVVSGTQQPARPTRNRGRRILFFRFYGFASDWRWHARIIRKHLMSILGLRA